MEIHQFFVACIIFTWNPLLPNPFWDLIRNKYDKIDGMHSYMELNDIHADAIDLSNDVVISCNAISYNITRLSQSQFPKACQIQFS